MPNDITSSQHQNSGNLQRAAGYASLSVALTLVGVKVWAWLATESVSILSSLVDSFLDVLASGITVIAIRLAMRPPDSEHRFGHGKVEGLAALAQAIIITLSAIFVLLEATERLFEPRPISNPESGIAVMLLSIVMTLGLLAFQRRVIRRTGSLAISADALHYRSDLFANMSVAIAIPLAAWTEWTIVDPLIGIAIACYILWTTYDIASSALDVLIDRELPKDQREHIETIARRHPDVRGFHDLRTRSGGSSYIIQFHLELDPAISLLNTHLILDDVEESIRKDYPECEIIVHADPLGFKERRDEFD
jgi:ferrous-iron efflux pump FieF